MQRPRLLSRDSGFLMWLLFAVLSVSRTRRCGWAWKADVAGAGRWIVLWKCVLSGREVGCLLGSILWNDSCGREDTEQQGQREPGGCTRVHSDGLSDTRAIGNSSGTVFHPMGIEYPIPGTMGWSLTWSVPEDMGPGSLSLRVPWGHWQQAAATGHSFHVGPSVGGTPCPPGVLSTSGVPPSSRGAGQNDQLEPHYHTGLTSSVNSQGV